MADHISKGVLNAVDEVENTAKCSSVAGNVCRSSCGHEVNWDCGGTNAAVDFGTSARTLEVMEVKDETGSV